jgi:hypothetical protein
VFGSVPLTPAGSSGARPARPRRLALTSVARQDAAGLAVVLSGFSAARLPASPGVRATRSGARRVRATKSMKRRSSTERRRQCGESPPRGNLGETGSRVADSVLSTTRHFLSRFDTDQQNRSFRFVLGRSRLYGSSAFVRMREITHRQGDRYLDTESP